MCVAEISAGACDRQSYSFAHLPDGVCLIGCSPDFPILKECLEAEAVVLEGNDPGSVMEFWRAIWYVATAWKDSADYGFNSRLIHGREDIMKGNKKEAAENYQRPRPNCL
jgi:hypothetical protein